jgi:multimeric flavodoxin WrbA
MAVVVGISGSPRKNGNTDILVKTALDECAKRGAKTVFLRLQNLKLNFCKACLKCKEKGFCVQKDDMQKVYQLLHKADAVVLGSPVYFATVSAQMKTFMDRLIALIGKDFESRLEKGKRALLLFAQGAEGANTFKYGLKPLVTTLRWLGCKVVGTVIADGINELGEVRSKARILSEVARLANNLLV